MRMRFLHFVAASISLIASVAQGQLSFALNPSSQNGTALDEMALTGSLTNLGRANLYLNDVQCVLVDAASNVLLADRDTFFANVPGILSSDETYAGVVFGVNLGAVAPAGVYSGTITILGGSNIFVTSNLASASFQISLPDSVGDGIPDWWRQLYFGGDGSTTNDESCAQCHADGAGAYNRFDYVVGLDPVRTSSVVTLNMTNYSSSALSFGPVAAGRVVVPEFCDNLATGQWTNLAVPTTTETNGSWYFLSDPNPSTNQRFYRVEISLP